MTETDNKNSKTESLKRWHTRKKSEGWKVVHGLVPAILANELKTIMRKFKYENPQYYINK